MMNVVMQAMEKGLIPDPAIRFGIRKLCRDRLKSLSKFSLEKEQSDATDYLESLKRSPIAVHTKEANEQHYELPPEFFSLVLGKYRKYSSGYWASGCNSLDEAEAVSLEVTMARAQLKDGMNILELGCGWGSLTLSMARKYPNATIVALSNSAPQREWIEAQAKTSGLKNVRVITRNIAEVENLGQEFGTFDRIVSVEMFEHLRNYELLFERLSKWLKDDGKLFVHIFTHRQYSYLFETEGEDNWMGRYFFTGGQMPAHNLLAHFQKNLLLNEQWAWDGTHYAKTSEAWLDRIDANEERVLQIFGDVYGATEASIWLQRWRVFFMSCAELFRYKNGGEWGVSHYLFSKKTGA
jgi:cyclopropane-fatty-acyl-phospholipid synthase